MAWFPSSFTPLLWCGLLVVSACAPVIERVRVAHQFDATVGCPTAEIHRVAGGYRVTGCGETAVYQCLESDNFVRGASSPREAFDRTWVEVAVLPDDCLLVHTESVTPVTRPRPPSKPSVAVREDPAYGALLRAEAPLADGQLRLAGAPAKYPGRIWASIRRPRVASPEHECSPELLADAEPIPIRKVKGKTHLLVLELEAADVRTVHRSLRLVLAGCGPDVEFHELARETLAVFAIRMFEVAGAMEATAHANRQGTPQD